MWQLWEWNGQYIQGNLVSKHKTKAATTSKAKKVFGENIILTEEERKEETIIWIDNTDGVPIGLIRKPKSKGAPRFRQGKKEKECK